MNQVAFHLGDRNELQRAVQNERLLRAERCGNKEVILAKSGLAVGRSLPLGDGMWSIGQTTLLGLPY